MKKKNERKGIKNSFFYQIKNTFIFIKKHIFGNNSDFMHFTISWRVAPPFNEVVYSKKITDCFSKRPSIKVFNNYYVVQVNYENEYTEIVTKINQFASSGVQGLYVIITPLMKGGSYNGLLEPEDWKKINMYSL
jgi:hypothetical protein